MIVLHLIEQRSRLPKRAGTVLVAATLAAAGLVAVVALVAAGGPVTVVERAVDSFTEPLQAEKEISSVACSASRGTDEATTGTSPGRWLVTSHCTARAPAASRRIG